MLLTPFYLLHSFITWAACAFGTGPADIIKGALTLAGLAVEAIGRIGGLDDVLDGFIYTRWAKCYAGAVKAWCAFCPADIGIEN
jgi:hypothetical protein